MNLLYICVRDKLISINILSYIFDFLFLRLIPFVDGLFEISLLLSVLDLNIFSAAEYCSHYDLSMWQHSKDFNKFASFGMLCDGFCNHWTFVCILFSLSPLRSIRGVFITCGKHRVWQRFCIATVRTYFSYLFIVYK